MPNWQLIYTKTTHDIMSSETKYYITHLVKDELPVKGFKKLLFCTTNTELMKKGLFLFGKGTRTFDSKQIQNKVNEGEIIELPKPRLLETGRGLWVDQDGNVFYGNITNPYKGKKLEKLFQPQPMTKPVRIYESKLKHLEKASVKKYVRLNSLKKQLTKNMQD